MATDFCSVKVAEAAVQLAYGWQLGRGEKNESPVAGTIAAVKATIGAITGLELPEE
jgi:hypothetical protein